MTLTEQIARALCRQKVEAISNGFMTGEVLDRWVDEHWQIEVTNAEMILPFIAVERERCALIADEVASDFRRGSDKAEASLNPTHQSAGQMLLLGVGAAERIAVAIRNQS